ncbi:hypothetical protein [Neobacillus niacini]|uniref:hypothetical protein n=1 Tax=Neobacillus niacini TaxID=86668 RepID=UPI0039838D05
MMPSNRPWKSELKPLDKKVKRKAIKLVLTIFGVVLALGIVSEMDFNGQQAAAANEETNYESTSYEEEEVETQKDFLEKSMDEYDVLYRDFLIIYQEGNPNMEQELDDLYSRVENLWGSLEVYKRGNQINYGAFYDHLNAVEKLKDATGSAYNASTASTALIATQADANAEYLIQESYEYQEEAKDRLSDH